MKKRKKSNHIVFSKSLLFAMVYKLKERNCCREEFEDRILTRADLPTPPEPNTTSLYSRMAGLLQLTA